MPPTPKPQSEETAPAAQQESKPERTKEQKALDARGDHVVEGTEEAQKKGYWGVRSNEHDDEEYSLATGPDAPYDEEKGAV